MKLLLQYITLGVIIGPLPVTLQDGQIADAVAVMADLNWIVNQVNGNSPSAQTLSAVSVSFGSATAMSTGVTAILGQTASTPTVQYDVLSEFNTTTGRFVAANPGYYWCSVMWGPTVTGITYSGFCGLQTLKNGVSLPGITLYLLPPSGLAANNSPSCTGSFGVKLNAGDYIQINGLLNFSGGSATIGVGLISINRLS